MKYQVIAFLFFAQLGYSQEWAPIGSVWYYEQVEFGPHEDNYHRITSVQDTMIIGVMTRKLKHEFVETDTTKFKGYLYSRNDGGKVSFYNFNDQEFELIYDFNAVQGDTIEIGIDTSNGLWTSQGNTVTTVVDTVYEEIRKGEIYTVQEYKSKEPGPWNTNAKVYTWIGEYWWLLPTVSLADPVTGGGLICYESMQRELIFGECDYLSQGVELLENKISVYPNPTRGTIWIEFQGKINELYITDVSGRRRRSENLSEIELKASGLYELEVHTTSGILRRRILNLP